LPWNEVNQPPVREVFLWKGGGKMRVERDLEQVLTALRELPSHRQAGKRAHAVEVNVNQGLKLGILDREEARACRRTVQEEMAKRWSGGRRGKRPDTQTPFDA
jgi:hypothetical protein